MFKLFFGKSGIGKTFKAKKFAENLKKNLVRIEEDNIPAHPHSMENCLYLIDDIDFFSNAKQKEVAFFLSNCHTEDVILTCKKISDVSLEILQTVEKIELQPLKENEIKDILINEVKIEKEEARKIAEECKGNIAWAILKAKFGKNDEFTQDEEFQVIEALKCLCKEVDLEKKVVMLEKIPLPVLFNWFRTSFFMQSLENQIKISEVLSTADELTYKTKMKNVYRYIASGWFLKEKILWNYTKKKTYKIEKKVMPKQPTQMKMIEEKVEIKSLLDW